MNSVKKLITIVTICLCTLDRFSLRYFVLFYAFDREPTGFCHFPKQS